MENYMEILGRRAKSASREGAKLGTDAKNRGLITVAEELIRQKAYLLEENTKDVEAAKEQIKANANPRKWICVEAEKVVVENIGNTIFFLMASNEDAESITKSFNSLAETK